MKTNRKTAAWLAAGILAVLAAGCENPLIADLMKDKDERDRERLLTPPASVPALAIAALSIGGVDGVVDETNRTVTVTLPLNTTPLALTSLIPTIAHNGTNISPASGAPQNFYQSGFTPVVYTLTGTGGATSVWTVIVRLNASTLNSIGAIAAYLTGAAGGSLTDPVPLPVAVGLSESGWDELLTLLAGQSKYVALDLSACTPGTEPSGGGFRSDGVFDPDYTNSAGKDKIVSLALPGGADEIVGGYYASNAFLGFTNLASASGADIAAIGGYAFAGCTGLTTVSFPAAATIGEYAFVYSNSLETVSLPVAATIGGQAFSGCSGLTSVDLPAAVSIGAQAFMGCSGLTSVDLPAAVTIDGRAFENCTGLTSVSLPAAVTIGFQAFIGCDGLTGITLGAVPPVTVGENLFQNTSSDALTVHVPSGNMDAYTAWYSTHSAKFSPKTLTFTEY